MGTAVKINGERVQALRGKFGLSQKQLAAKVGVDHGTVSRWERKEIERVRLDIFGRLRLVLGASEADLRGEGPLPERKTRRDGPMSLIIDTACRNALALVADRYRVPRRQIVEAAPLLFFIAAEQSLKERKHTLQAKREAANALAGIRIAHLPQHDPVDKDALVSEERSIQARDIFGALAIHERDDDGDVKDYPDDYDDITDNPLVVFLRKSLAAVGGSADGVFWGLSPGYEICAEEAAAIVGGNAEAASAILNGVAGLHEMPTEIRKAGPEEKAKWARGESDRRKASFDALWDDPDALIAEVNKIAENIGHYRQHADSDEGDEL